MSGRSRQLRGLLGEPRRGPWDMAVHGPRGGPRGGPLRESLRESLREPLHGPLREPLRDALRNSHPLSAAGTNVWLVLALTLGLAGLVGSGCITSRPALTPRFYQLPVPATELTARARSGPAVRFGRVSAAPHLRDRMVWHLNDVELVFDEHQRWAAPPEEMVRDGLSALLGSGDPESSPRPRAQGEQRHEEGGRGLTGQGLKEQGLKEQGLKEQGLDDHGLEEEREASQQQDVGGGQSPAAPWTLDLHVERFEGQVTQTRALLALRVTLTAPGDRGRRGDTGSRADTGPRSDPGPRGNSGSRVLKIFATAPLPEQHGAALARSLGQALEQASVEIAETIARAP